MIWPIALLLTAGGVLFALYGLPQAYRLLQVARWDACKGVLALTYDDGPDTVTTPALLDLLARLDAPATFYLAGFRSERCPEELARLRSSGHELGTHAQSHRNAWKISPIREYQDSMAGYRTLAGVVPDDAPYRPPFGKISLITLIGMWIRRRRVDWWSIPTNDTDDVFPCPTELARSILDQGKTVVLMHSHHDEPHRRQFMLAATQALVEEARRRNVELVTMGALERRVSGGAQ